VTNPAETNGLGIDVSDLSDGSSVARLETMAGGEVSTSGRSLENEKSGDSFLGLMSREERPGDEEPWGVMMTSSVGGRGDEGGFTGSRRSGGGESLF